MYAHAYILHLFHYNDGFVTSVGFLALLCSYKMSFAVESWYCII